MHKYEEALKILSNISLNFKTERVAVNEAFNRALAEDLYTDFPFPDCRKSAVDGYAIVIWDKMEYTIKGESVPGDLRNADIQAGECIFVMTGGIVPDNTDAVVRVEDVEEENDHILLNRKPEKGVNINLAGEEFSENTLFAEHGKLLDELAFPALCYSGKKEVKVYKKPKIGVFVTGDEILEPGDDYKRGHVFNTNRYILHSLLGHLPADIHYLGRFNDDEEDIAEVLEKSDEYDILVSSGGVSMGKYDFVKKILQEYDYEIIINKTAIKPGSPLMVARNENCTIFGMPGYPAAFATNLILYLLPFVRKSCGIKNFENNIVKGKLRTSMRSRINALYFNRAIVKIEDGEPVAYDPGSQKTSHFLNFFNVNGLVMLDENVGSLEKGSIVNIIPVRGL
ncbi:molybdenum cofactor synthesis domain protein [Flexistipes sinusarabici DSM 4947]|uniref:Molybdopterin molybdenumtransferase n=3 Tax=Flexistipes sinusarabici TaxID=2352 RepID=F8E694_FLESM|nr:molybdopterin molybdotransferase MoeA [Flexistipes sinusarabici]AEI15861.1 molybdenum cofactor synthesis domain protein [Flexistipes sinusarabici DSM 4947]